MGQPQKKSGRQNSLFPKPSKTDEKIEMPMFFARELMKQLLYNTSKSTPRTSQTFSKYTKSDLFKYLKNPTQYEKELRKASQYMYGASMHYKRLIDYYASLYYMYYVISPVKYEGKINETTFAKQYYKTALFMETVCSQELWTKIFKIALRDGAYYGVRWYDGLSYFCQDIDPDYCMITAVTDGEFRYSVDMSLIGEEKMELYHPAFAKMYQSYKKTGKKWQDVPSEISVCIKADPSTIRYTVPTFSATMPSLYTVSNAEELQEMSDEVKNYKMVSGQIPSDDDGKPLLSDSDVLPYYNHIAAALGDNIGLALSPFKLDSINFNHDGVSDIDMISRATKNYWSTAGTSSLLHGVDNNTAGVTKLAIKGDESFVWELVLQAERSINNYLYHYVNSTTKFQIAYLPITIFNRDEMVKYYKDSAAMGLGKSYYAASIGIPQASIAGLSYLENNILGMDKLVPLKSSYNMGSDSQAGRPEKSDEELDEEGEKTRNSGANGNR